jgi:hypothetical protein
MDKIQSVKFQLHLQEWARRVAECQSSKMTVRAWCDAHQISLHIDLYIKSMS